MRFGLPAVLRSTTAALSMSAAAPRFSVAFDGVAELSALSSKEWLLSRPGGAYTTARTCSRAQRLFEWETHVTRTASSARAMVEAEADEARRASLLKTTADVTDAARLRPRMTSTAAAAVDAWAAEYGPADELKVTVLVTWDGDTTTVGCHVAPLPPLPAPPVRVEVRGAPRANAAAKDSSWVAERAPLEALMRGSNVGDVNELLLVSDDGAILEGSQTNFFAIEPAGAGKPSHVRTAGDGVLEGTVRRLLLEVCEREGIPVVLTPPQLADAARWEGAMISSTSRLLLPVDELYVPQPGACAEEADRVRRFDNGDGSLAARLRALVAEEVEAHSSALRE